MRYSCFFHLSWRSSLPPLCLPLSLKFPNSQRSADMSLEQKLHLLLVLLLCLTSIAIAQQTHLFDLSQFSSAPSCAQRCLEQASISGINKYKCNVGAPQSCLCSANEGQSAFVSSIAFHCASEDCSNNNQVAATAAEIWSAYCVTNNALPASAGSGSGSEATTPASGMERGLPSHLVQTICSWTAVSSRSN